MIYIVDKEFEDVKIEVIVSDETRREAIGCVSEAMLNAQKGKEFTHKEVSKNLNNLIYDVILRNKDVLIHLSV
jgi:hypothetical protein